MAARLFLIPLLAEVKSGDDELESFLATFLNFGYRERERGGVESKTKRKLQSGRLDTISCNAQIT